MPSLWKILLVESWKGIQWWTENCGIDSGSLRSSSGTVETGWRFCCYQRILPLGERSEPTYLITDVPLPAWAVPALSSLSGQCGQARMRSLNSLLWAFRGLFMCLTHLKPYTLSVFLYSRPWEVLELRKSIWSLKILFT